MPDTVKAYRCRHIHATGNRCGSKSLREGNFCFYHNTTRKPAPKPEAPPINPAKEAFDLPFPEDRASIQLAIGEVLRRIANNTIDPRRAGLLLYGLQIASLNLPRERAARETPLRHRIPLHRRAGSRHEQDRNDQPDLVEEIETDPTLGPVAPIAEYTGEDDDHPLTLAGRLLRELDHPEEFNPDNKEPDDKDPDNEDKKDDPHPSPRHLPRHPPTAEKTGGPDLSPISAVL